MAQSKSSTQSSFWRPDRSGSVPSTWTSVSSIRFFM